jgi:hypothetical protein
MLMTARGPHPMTANTSADFEQTPLPTLDR